MPVDAEIFDGNRGFTGGACATGPLAWWAVGADLESASSAAEAALSPLLAADHPIVIVQLGDATSWSLMTNASATNGIGQQYFPYDRSAQAVAADQSGASIASSAPEDAAWLRFADAAQTQVWIPLAQVSTVARYGDDSCTTLSSAAVSAVIPVLAGGIAFVAPSGANTTVQALFGPPTSAQPAGWRIRLTFTGEKVQVSLK